MYLLAKDGIYIYDYPRKISKTLIPCGGRADVMIRCNTPGTFDLVDGNDRFGIVFVEGDRV